MSSLSLRTTQQKDQTTTITVVVSVKVAPKAVVRNRIRRRIREIVRQQISRMKKGCRIIITVRTPHLPRHLELKTEILSLLQKSAMLNQ